jgi:superfamily I DNA/RNA helicase
MAIDKIKEENLEEELRLMYGAATQDRENLVFTYPNQIYERVIGMEPDRPSRFIDGVPQSILPKQSARFLISMIIDYDFLIVGDILGF